MFLRLQKALTKALLHVLAHLPGFGIHTKHSCAKKGITSDQEEQEIRKQAQVAQHADSQPQWDKAGIGIFHRVIIEVNE